MKLDREHINLCKQILLMPNFSIKQLSIQTKNNRLKDPIGKMIREYELEIKYNEKAQLKEEIKLVYN